MFEGGVKIQISAGNNPNPPFYACVVPSQKRSSIIYFYMYINAYMSKHGGDYGSPAEAHSAVLTEALVLLCCKSDMRAADAGRLVADSTDSAAAADVVVAAVDKVADIAAEAHVVVVVVAPCSVASAVVHH